MAKIKMEHFCFLIIILFAFAAVGDSIPNHAEHVEDHRNIPEKDDVETKITQDENNSNPPEILPQVQVEHQAKAEIVNIEREVYDDTPPEMLPLVDASLTQGGSSQENEVVVPAGAEDVDGDASPDEDEVSPPAADDKSAQHIEENPVGTSESSPREETGDKNEAAMGSTMHIEKPVDAEVHDSSPRSTTDKTEPDGPIRPADIIGGKEDDVADPPDEVSHFAEHNMEEVPVIISDSVHHKEATETQPIENTVVTELPKSEPTPEPIEHIEKNMEHDLPFSELVKDSTKQSEAPDSTLDILQVQPIKGMDMEPVQTKEKVEVEDVSEQSDIPADSAHAQGTEEHFQNIIEPGSQVDQEGSKNIPGEEPTAPANIDAAIEPIPIHSDSDLPGPGMSDPEPETIHKEAEPPLQEADVEQLPSESESETPLEIHSTQTKSEILSEFPEQVVKVEEEVSKQISSEEFVKPAEPVEKEPEEEFSKWAEQVENEPAVFVIPTEPVEKDPEDESVKPAEPVEKEPEEEFSKWEEQVENEPAVFVRPTESVEKDPEDESVKPAEPVEKEAGEEFSKWTQQVENEPDEVVRPTEPVGKDPEDEFVKPAEPEAATESVKDHTGETKSSDNGGYKAGSICTYCKYCKLCVFCRLCPLCGENKDGEYCGMCKYCKHCYLCDYVCVTVCNPGSFLDMFSGAIYSVLPNFPSNIKEEADKDIDRSKDFIKEYL